jgi:hypothetical protein
VTISVTLPIVALYMVCHDSDSQLVVVSAAPLQSTENRPPQRTEAAKLGVPLKRKPRFSVKKIASLKIPEKTKPRFSVQQKASF